MLSRRETQTGMTERKKKELAETKAKGKARRGEEGVGWGISFWAGDGTTHGFPLEWVDNISQHCQHIQR